MVMAPSAWHDIAEDQTTIAYPDDVLSSGRERSRGLIADALKSRIDAVDHDECIPGEEDAFFVADLGEVYRQHLRWARHLPNIHPHYAVKCNPAPQLVRFLASLGTGFDCASKSEIDLVLSLGVSPDRIVYAQPVKTNSYLTYAKSRGVKQMTFDNTDELRKVAAKCPGAELLLRITTDDSAALCQLSMKFGAALKDCPKLLKLAKTLGLNVVGVAFHVGSGASDPLAFKKAVSDSKTVFNWGHDYGHEMKILDVGGGFSDDSFDDMAGVLRAELDEHFPSSSGVRIIAEPGRYYAATAFTLACHVIARRVVESGDVEFEGPEGSVRSVDDKAGEIVSPAASNMHNSGDHGAFDLAEEREGSGSESYMLYLNDGVYGNFSSIMFDHQQPIPRVLKADGRFFYQILTGRRITYSIWGPTCDGIDCISSRVELSEKVEVGDWMYFEDMGAYTMCSATRFNGFPDGHDVVWVGADALPGFGL
ncbi:hypothetical protein P152DRAFT_505663 [Eremomyces bilateralis CBS 781.70]|uniref:ornithine decarboxylase n=1 Tax=Eremomyces bilateralis CBS 781.70 TaxID=1392243 RepID=A0A6G1GD44_9PEZI|nr:uncharacterized protein P152DRAFT_505663 [Eremomyces bilateralis CBS 781.70]KAF1815932.1 hypothetical protein P152DRAFT_505663 [Eremomyces bilateralis CBS 781.70]